MATVIPRREASRAFMRDGFPLTLTDQTTGQSIQVRTFALPTKLFFSNITKQRWYEFTAMATDGALYRVQVWFSQHPDLYKNYRKYYGTNPPEGRAHTEWEMTEGSVLSA